MIRALMTAASGMKAQQLQVDTIANNIANVNTTGFKKNELAFREMLYQTMREPGAPTGQSQMAPTGLQVGSGTEIASSMKMFKQGEVVPTGNSLDLAIIGEGFFKVKPGQGDERFTRDGTFRLDGTGTVVTSEGYPLVPEVKIPPDATEVIVSEDGTVSVMKGDSSLPETVGTISLFRFANSSGLKAQGGNLYSVTASSGAVSDAAPGISGTGTIRQAALERSNVQVVDELVALILAQRNYEINSRAIRVSDDMLQQVNNMVR
ncbi:MAG: flagellar basal-body rod protein FlgG [Planctomycetota bacterium]